MVLPIVEHFLPAEGLEQVKGASAFCGVPLNASKWLRDQDSNLG